MLVADRLAGLAWPTLTPRASLQRTYLPSNLVERLWAGHGGPLAAFTGLGGPKGLECGQRGS
jgi:hypothetical protein